MPLGPHGDGQAKAIPEGRPIGAEFLEKMRQKLGPMPSKPRSTALVKAVTPSSPTP
jgi:hypothetical protein